MKQKLIVTSIIELTEGDFTKNVTDFIADLEREARGTWGHDADGGYEGPFIDAMETRVEVADLDEPVAEGTEYNPEVTISRTITQTIEQTLVVRALELGLGWGLVTQAHALDEHLLEGDVARGAAFELVEDKVFFAPKFKSRLVEKTLDVQNTEPITIEIEE